MKESANERTCGYRHDAATQEPEISWEVPDDAGLLSSIVCGELNFKSISYQIPVMWKKDVIDHEFSKMCFFYLK